MGSWRCPQLLIGAFVMVLMASKPASAQPLKVTCRTQSQSTAQTCLLDVYDSVLQGLNGIQLRVVFPGGYAVEALCLELLSGHCKVKSTQRSWEAGRIRTVSHYGGFETAFVIETSRGVVLAVCDTLPAR
ncbi:MAG: hypothetical protein WBN89_11430 [Prochlorococcaceae cyanobacterium]